MVSRREFAAGARGRRRGSDEKESDYESELKLNLEATGFGEAAAGLGATCTRLAPAAARRVSSSVPVATSLRFL